jgi:uncharacterized membrane protein
MSKTLIGLLFILAGVVYGSLAIDDFYKHTLGWLVEHEWIKPPAPNKNSLSSVLGRKGTIFAYAAVLIIIGVFILWNRNT